MFLTRIIILRDVWYRLVINFITENLLLLEELENMLISLFVPNTVFLFVFISLFNYFSVFILLSFIYSLFTNLFSLVSFQRYQMLHHLQDFSVVIAGERNRPHSVMHSVLCQHHCYSRNEQAGNTDSNHDSKNGRIGLNTFWWI